MIRTIGQLYITFHLSLVGGHLIRGVEVLCSTSLMSSLEHSVAIQLFTYTIMATGQTGNTVTENITESITKTSIQPNVDNRIVAGMGHCQPMTSKPNIFNVFIFVDLWIVVTNHNQYVEWKPTKSEGRHAGDHHLDHLGRSRAKLQRG